VQKGWVVRKIRLCIM